MDSNPTSDARRIFHAALRGRLGKKAALHFRMFMGWAVVRCLLSMGILSIVVGGLIRAELRGRRVPLLAFEILAAAVLPMVLFWLLAARVRAKQRARRATTAWETHGEIAIAGLLMAAHRLLQPDPHFYWGPALFLGLGFLIGGGAILSLADLLYPRGAELPVERVERAVELLSAVPGVTRVMPVRNLFLGSGHVALVQVRVEPSALFDLTAGRLRAVERQVTSALYPVSATYVGLVSATP